jgi:hypothetical protein
MTLGLFAYHREKSYSERRRARRVPHTLASLRRLNGALQRVLVARKQDSPTLKLGGLR